MNKYVLSIIIDCNNCNREKIQKTIDSIVCSSQNCDKTEIILLNKPESFQIEATCRTVDCLSENLVEGLNNAKRMAQGMFINHISAGDYYYKKSIDKIFELMNTQDVELIHCPVINANNKYQIETTYTEAEVVSYESKEFYLLPIKVKGCFFKKELLENIDFHEGMLDSFESQLLSEIFIRGDIQCVSAKCGVIASSDCDVFVNEQISEQLPQYLLQFQKNVQMTISQQYYALIELRKLLTKQEIRYKENLSEQKKQSYLFQIKEILKNISNDVIIDATTFILQHKHYFLYLKYGHHYLEQLKIKKVLDKETQKEIPYVTYENGLLFNLTNIGNFKINILENKDNILILDGVDVFSFISENYEIIAIDDQENIYRPVSMSWPLLDKKGFIGEKIYTGHRFRFEIPLNNIKTLHFRMKSRKNDETFELVPSFGVYSKLVKKLKMSYYAKDNAIIKYQAKGLRIYKNTFVFHLKCEIKFMLQLMKQKKWNMIFMRMAYYFMNFFKKKPIWLMRDNEKRAKDSGAEMFKYFHTWEKNNIAKGYFILDKNCSDYQKMKQYGKIIQPDSFQYKLYHLLADKLIDTRGGINHKYIFKDDADYIKDLCHWDYIWLIHGIMTRNESTWTNKYILNAKLFATCNIREYESVLDEENGYGYEVSEVALTGLPRHDALAANKQKKILFLPTWRKHLAGDLIPGTSDRSYVEDFKQTDYYQFYNGLLNDERLLKVMREKGYTGDFYLHPSFMKQCHDFVENDVMRIGKEPADTNQLIGECSLLITDYSSAQFEGAYLNTPVIYTQYDADTFSDNHTGNDGYFEYERDGFGPVCYDLDQAVESIIQYILNDCQNIEPYETRADEFFAHRDKKNSERVFEQILKIDGYHKENFHIEEDDKYVYIYEGNDLKKAELIENRHKIYNSYLDIVNYMRNIEMNEDSFTIHGTIMNDSHIDLARHSFEISIGDYQKAVSIEKTYHKKKAVCYDFRVDIAYESILLTKKSTPVLLAITDESGYGYCNHLKYQYVAKDDSLVNRQHRRFHCSKTRILEDKKTSVFVRETIGNNVYLCVRDINVTDSTYEQRKIKRAYLLARLCPFHKAKKSVLCFEKFASKYEESASVLFEKIIDSGEKNTYFVIDQNSHHYHNIPEKYKKYIIHKYSFKHYFYFFLARAFIATESMNHMIELNISVPEVTTRITEGAYDYIFLQHGVMYMYCLENRSDFIKGQGFTNYSKVVVSSQTEADHFIQYGHFLQDDLIVSGLPKFDRCRRNEGADKILIMPTSRDFEYNVIRLTPSESTYYKFVKNIINAVPEELKSKIVVVGHPLLKDQLLTTDLKEYMPDEIIYDDLLADTKLLITDYSSISYDAFYRGANVLFCWEDKEMCLNAMNYKLMLNDDNVFADVSYDYSDLQELIRKNYYGTMSEEYVHKYRNIVEHHDNCNTQRCYDFLLKHGYYGKVKKRNIAKCKLQNFTRKIYTGYRRRHTDVELFYGKKILVKNRDYKVYYLNNIRISKFAIAIFVGHGQYYGIKIKRFKISESITHFKVSGVRYIDGTLNLDQLALKGRRGYLSRGKDYSVSIEESSIEEYCYVVLSGKKRYGGKIRLLLKSNNK